MKAMCRFLNPIVAAALPLVFTIVSLPSAMQAQDVIEVVPDPFAPMDSDGAPDGPAPILSDAEKLADFIARLKTAADAGEGGRIEAEIRILWGKSGSAAMDMLMQRADDALMVGNTAAAVEHFTAIIDHDPDFLTAYEGRAAAYVASGDVGPALADLAHVLSIDPNRFDSLGWLAVILEESGRKERALATYRAILEIHPQLGDAQAAADRLEKELEGQES